MIRSDVREGLRLRATTGGGRPSPACRSRSRVARATPPACRAPPSSTSWGALTLWEWTPPLEGSPAGPADPAPSEGQEAGLRPRPGAETCGGGAAGDAAAGLRAAGDGPAEEEVIEYWTVEEGSAGPAGGHGAVIVHSGHEHHNVRHTHEVVEHGDHRAGKAGAAERRAGHPAERPGQQRHHAEPDGGAGETEPG
eukprot:CAMPEP_0179240934 /NCGR_PEP_ID=MMETSP0797-20121207/16234_1 /TAXON_ID=47934 /ORGANISM="Dinophysis acuminata, Strain DAEP01" /LENGTH=194 /DNA_ID=CAMNT_0020948307 /DNA_START=129 /DNA_END=711 /DNA_ORIENTATION=-